MGGVSSLLNRAAKVNGAVEPAARATLERAVNATGQSLRRALAGFRPCRMEVHAYLLAGGGASGTARELDDLGNADDADPLLVAKAVTVVQLLVELAARLSDKGPDELIPVRPAW